jgi:hypothetical protein
MRNQYSSAKIVATHDTATYTLVCLKYTNCQWSAPQEFRDNHPLRTAQSLLYISTSLLTWFVAVVRRSFMPSYGPSWTWQAQEVYLKLTMSVGQEGVKKAVQRVLGRVPWASRVWIEERPPSSLSKWLHHAVLTFYSAETSSQLRDNEL